MYGIPLRQEGSGLLPEFKEDTIFVTMATREQAEDKAFKDKSCLKSTIGYSKSFIPNTKGKEVKREFYLSFVTPNF